MTNLVAQRGRAKCIRSQCILGPLDERKLRIITREEEQVSLLQADTAITLCDLCNLIHTSDGVYKVAAVAVSSIRARRHGLVVQQLSVSVLVTILLSDVKKGSVPFIGVGYG